jgi:hypothetical protein
MNSAISVGSYVPSSQPDRRPATLSEELGKVGVNIERFCATVADGKGVLHVFVHDAALAGTALRRAGYTPVPSAFRAPVQTWCPPRAINLRVELVTKRWHASHPGRRFTTPVYWSKAILKTPRGKTSVSERRSLRQTSRDRIHREIARVL